MNTHDIRCYCFQDLAGTTPSVNDGDPVRVMHYPLGSQVTDVEVFDRVLTDAEISAFHQRLVQAADTPHIVTG